MGKATGFIEYDRQGLSCRAPKERIRDFAEFKIPLEADAVHLGGGNRFACGNLQRRIGTDYAVFGSDKALG